MTPAPTPAVTYPWRRTTRSAVQFAIGLAPLLPFIYQAATLNEPEAATGLAAAALAISAAVTRVMALPAVETFLQRWRLTSWLSARPPAVP